jgi:hypothetical protein
MGNRQSEINHQKSSIPIQLTRKIRLRILTILVLFSILALIGFGWVSFENRQTASIVEIGSLTANKSNLEAQLTQQQAGLEGISARLQDSSDTVKRLNETVITLTAQLNADFATQTAQQNEIDTLNADKEKTQAAYQETLAKLSRLQTEIVCDNASSFRADYTNNPTISKSLKTFIGEIGGNLTYTTWDLLWPASKNSIHRITVVQDGRSFTNIFMVYFDEKDFSTRGVFWINRSCWLDRAF